jgi:hypothetical protein
MRASKSSKFSGFRCMMHGAWTAGRSRLLQSKPGIAGRSRLLQSKFLVGANLRFKARPPRYRLPGADWRRRHARARG